MEIIKKKKNWYHLSIYIYKGIQSQSFLPNYLKIVPNVKVLKRNLPQIIIFHKDWNYIKIIQREKY